MAITKGYQLIGRTRRREGGTTKRHFGFIKWLNRGNDISKIEFILVNRYQSKQIKCRFNRMYDNIIKVINKEFTLEDLSKVNKSTGICINRRKVLKRELQGK